MLHAIKRLVPPSWLGAYHYVLAVVADVWYRHPSRQMIVVGVTGTNGKTTTSYLIAKALEGSGFQTGCATTALIKIGNEETLNKSKMTMQGRFALQKLLRQMVDAGCKYAVIETSSQGLIQFRHLGIAYDVAVFTNLTPEHIEAHGGFENYKKAKRLLFERLATLPPKYLDGKEVPRATIVNADSDHAEYYAQTQGLKRVEYFSLQGKKGLSPQGLQNDEFGARFTVNGVPVHISLPGLFNVDNALAALAVAQVLDVDLASASAKLETVAGVPGRMEWVNAGQPWKVLIDYAPEPESFRKLYEAIALIEKKRIIHVFGSCGGGRDVARRPILGALGAERADILFVTNEDPYDDNPQEIIDQVAAGAIEKGKVLGKDLFKVIDRTEAINQAMQLAEPGDLVVLTGKGCEPWVCIQDGNKIPWNERAIAEAAIRSALTKSTYET